MNRTRIVMADDHTLILEGFRSLLGSHCELVGIARDGRSLVETALRLRPEVVVLDIGMPLLNGIDAARQIKKAVPEIRILFLTMHANPAYLREALAAGASGYLLKTSAAEELAAAVQKVASGETYFTAGLGEGVVERSGNRHPLSRSQSALTARQREILQLVAEGRTAKQIAGTLNVAVQTVAFHKYKIMNKLGLRTTAELTRYAIEEGLVG
jgi:DNA-binding NarL/FixJ family response regulator